MFSSNLKGEPQLCPIERLLSVVPPSCRVSLTEPTFTLKVVNKDSSEGMEHEQIDGRDNQ